MSGRQVWISRPEVRVIEVIEVRFLRGLGESNDPVREVKCLYDRRGTLLAEVDPSDATLPKRELVS